MRTLGAVVVTVVVAGAGVAASRLTGKTSVVVANPRAAAVQQTTSGTGSVIPVVEVPVALNYPGLSSGMAVQSVAVIPGSLVHKGDPLVQLDPTQIQAYLLRLNTELAGDRVTMADSTTPEAIAAWQLRVTLDQQALAAANTFSATITSPLTGEVSGVSVKSGTIVTTGKTLLTVVDTSTERVSASVPIRQAANVVPGEPVALSFPDIPGLNATGTVESVSPGTNSRGLNVPVSVRFDNSASRIRLGMQAYVTVTQTHQALVTVPLIAVHDLDGSPFVLLVVNGKVSQRSITVGAFDSNRVEVTQGLATSDSVVLTNAQRLKQGDTVRIASVDRS